MSALSEALKVGGAGLTQLGTAKMQGEMQARRDAAMAKREENLIRLRAQIGKEAAVEEQEFKTQERLETQEFKTQERSETQEFEAGESALERESREKIAGMKAKDRAKPTEASAERARNRLQRERESHRKQMEGHTTWGVLLPEYRAQFQAEGDSMIGTKDPKTGKEITAGQAANITLGKLRKLDQLVQGAMQSPQAKGKTKEEIIDLIMKNDKYRSQLGL